MADECNEFSTNLFAVTKEDTNKEGNEYHLSIKFDRGYSFKISEKAVKNKLGINADLF